MQFDAGAWLGYQGGETDPVFWVWRPSTGPHVEYWVFYKYNQSGGFTAPGSVGVTSVDWKLKKTTAGNYTDGCEFLTWVADEFDLAEADLEVREHAVAILDCTK